MDSSVAKLFATHARNSATSVNSLPECSASFRGCLKFRINRPYYFEPGGAACMIGRSTLMAAWSDRGSLNA
jgi:hypothetical protein